MKTIRIVTAICTSIILVWLAFLTLGVPAELPSWRHIAGVALLGGAALIFDVAWMEAKR